MGKANYRYLNRKNYLDANAHLNEVKQDLYNYDKYLRDDAGIYWLTRENKPKKDGTVERFIYVGQAKKVLTRLAQHFITFDQRINLSLKNRGLYYEHTNPYAWKISFRYCDESQLNELERRYITEAQNKGFTLYNITSGGQDEGKEDINERKAGKNYTDGVAYGKEVALREVKEFFDKYLNYSPKPVYKKAHKKNEAPALQEIYVKKFKEFGDLLNGKADDTTTD